jgi:uncharacterized protein Yka (UPF0111/DUF47 family)
MRSGRWFLPETPDLIGMLGRQLSVTIEGMDAFTAWAGGDADAADATRSIEHRADQVKHELQRALRSAFITPIEPEDLFALSHGIDRILNEVKDLVGESEVMACQPDAPVAEIAVLLASAVRSIADAVARLGVEPGDPEQSADAAIKASRRIEKVYRRAMASLLEVEDLREVIARRELYRRCSRIAESIVAVAERVGYALAKES